jgi:uncharacterized tellurite resistance protein B-like protein
MFNRIFDLLNISLEGVGSTKPDKLQLAVAALLVQAAEMDDVFELSERLSIERLLADRFGLGLEAVRDLLKAAEKASHESNQIYAFTRVAADRMNGEERIGLIEMLWEVAYADGILDPDEDALVRRIAGLIYVSDFDRGAARKRVLDRLGLNK